LFIGAALSFCGDQKRNSVAQEKEFQEKIAKLGSLVGNLERESDSNSTPAARELVQLLMEVHGAGIERIMELVFESGAHGEEIIGRFGQDPIIRSLLLLYSLHPDNLETRILTAVDNVRARLCKSDAEVEVLSIHDGVVQLQLRTSGHACSSTTKNLQAIVEESIYELAPDLASLLILAPTEEPASGFIPLERLLKHPIAVPAPAVHGAEVEGAD
jgi:hypothetical protein